ncbi:hypothetical protein Aduo_002313 [Ancylostoma duodenale]
MPLHYGLGRGIRSLTFDALRILLEESYAAVYSAHPHAVGRPTLVAQAVVVVRSKKIGKEETEQEAHQAAGRQQVLRGIGSCCTSLHSWQAQAGRRGLGFSYQINNGQRFILVRLDLARKRAAFLSTIAEARSNGS